jgi:hypothetical protein
MDSLRKIMETFASPRFGSCTSQMFTAVKRTQKRPAVYSYREE